MLSLFERYRRALFTIGSTALLWSPGVVPAIAQEVSHSHVAGNVWRIDGAIDVILAQVGDDGLLMVDTGYPFAEAGVRAALREIAGTDTPDLLLNTHAHHAFSNHLYGGGADIVAHTAAARRMASGYLMAGMSVPPADSAALPGRVFDDSSSFEMNGERVSVIHLPGAHTDSDAVVIFHGSNVVAAGDVVVPHMPWISVDSEADVQGLLAALDRLIEIVPPGAHIVPGHDATTLDVADVRRFRAMIAEAADVVKSGIDAGLGLRSIVTRGLPGLEEWRGGVPEALFIESLYRSYAEPRRTTGPALEFVNGRWFDGISFETRRMYAVEGVLTTERPAVVDSTLDLGGGYVVPPFGEAHSHQLGDPGSLEEESRALLAEGTFYVMVQDPAMPLGDRHRALYGRGDRPDVAYTQGVVTPSWGVIADFYEMMAAAGRFGDGATLAGLDGDVVFRIDSPAELDAKWERLASRNDRFIKVVVAFSDDIERRRADPETFGARPPAYSAKPGVTEEVLRALVARAHAAGLQVSAHIETRADFRLAVDAGVDWIAHMPASWQVGEGTGYGADEAEPWLLTREDAGAARRSGVTVVTTLLPWRDDDPRADLFRRVHAHNLEVLVDVGAALALGSDTSAGSVADEALYLRSFGVLDDAALLRLLSTQTPRRIFPELKIGHLREGWEASFLVLGGDPTENLEHITDIRLRVKQGVVLP